MITFYLQNCHYKTDSLSSEFIDFISRIAGFSQRLSCEFIGCSRRVTGVLSGTVDPIGFHLLSEAKTIPQTNFHCWAVFQS